MKKRLIITILLVLSLTMSSYAENNTFSDVTNHWSKDWITNLVSRDITSGYPDGTFKPDNPVTIEEFITFTVRALQNIDPVKYAVLEDGGYWSNKFVNVAIKNNLIQIGEFADLRRAIKREEMASIIIKAYGLNNAMTQSNINTDIIDLLHDYYLVNDFYKNSMLLAVREGFITGKDTINEKMVVDPNGTATRAEAAVLIVKLLEPEKRSPVVIDRPSTTFKVDTYNGGVLEVIEMTYYAKKNDEGKYVTEIFDIHNYFESQDQSRFDANWIYVGGLVVTDFVCDPKYKEGYTGQFWTVDKVDIFFKLIEGYQGDMSDAPYNLSIYKHDRYKIEYSTMGEYLDGEYGEQLDYFFNFFFEEDASQVKELIYSSLDKTESFSGNTVFNGRIFEYSGNGSGISIDFEEKVE